MPNPTQPPASGKPASPGWRERLAQLPPDQQERVKAAIRETMALRREHKAKCDAAALILRCQQRARG